MKKKCLACVLGLCLVMGVVGCSGTTEGVSEGDAAMGEATEAESDWAVILESEFDFGSYQIGFNTAEQGLSVGAMGEIHYYDAATSEWPRSDNESVCRFGMEYADSQVCYSCGNSGGVTKSVDGGVSFTKMTPFGDNGQDACRLMSFIDAETGMIAGKAKLAVTSDGATTWKELAAPCEMIAVRMVTLDNFYVIGSDLNLYETVDGGSNWTNTPMNLPKGSEYLNGIQSVVFSVDGEDAYTVFCIDKESSNLCCYSTTDGFKSVTESPLPKAGMVMGTLYLNHEGNLITVMNTLSKTATVIERHK